MIMTSDIELEYSQNQLSKSHDDIDNISIYIYFFTIPATLALL